MMRSDENVNKIEPQSISLNKMPNSQFTLHTQQPTNQHSMIPYLHYYKMIAVNIFSSQNKSIQVIQPLSHIKSNKRLSEAWLKLFAIPVEYLIRIILIFGCSMFKS